MEEGSQLNSKVVPSNTSNGHPNREDNPSPLKEISQIEKNLTKPHRIEVENGNNKSMVSSRNSPLKIDDQIKTKEKPSDPSNNTMQNLINEEIGLRVYFEVKNKFMFNNDSIFNFQCVNSYFEYHNNTYFFKEQSVVLLNDNGLSQTCEILLYSKITKRCLLLFTVAEITAYLMHDYSYRIHHEQRKSITINVAAYIIEIISNCFFTLELILLVIAKGSSPKSRKELLTINNISLFSILVTSWISVAGVQPLLIEIFKHFRILTIFRLFPVLQTKVNAFFGSFKHLGKTFFPLACLILFYAIIGISFFQGHIESRCRITEHPEDGEWKASESIEHTCGYVKCPQNLFCGNPADYDIEPNSEEYDNEEFLWGFSNFNDIPNALFSVFNFLMVTGWVQTTYIYWRAQDKTVSALYFVSLVLILSQIFSNIVLATLYEGFLHSTSIKGPQTKSNKKVHPQNQEGQENEEIIFKKTKARLRSSKINKTTIQHFGVATQTSLKKERMKKKSVFQVILQSQIVNLKSNEEINELFQQDFQFSVFCRIVNILLSQFSKSSLFHFIRFVQIVGSTVILAIDSISLTEVEYIRLNKADFAMTILLFFEVFILLSAKGFKKYFKKNLNKLDAIIVVAHIISYILESKNDHNIFNPLNQYFIFIRWTKILRCIKLLNSFSIFGNFKIYIQTYYQTLQSIPEFLIVFIVLILLFAQIGREIFANIHVSHVSETSSAEEGSEMRVNYDSLEDSLIAVILMFLNEEWHITMYEYSRLVGYQSILFHLICILICQVLYTRLFIAIFISYFMKWLRKYEIEYKIYQPYLETIQKILKKITTAISFITKAKNKVKNENKSDSNSESSENNQSNVDKNQVILLTEVPLLENEKNTENKNNLSKTFQEDGEQNNDNNNQFNETDKKSLENSAFLKKIQPFGAQQTSFPSKNKESVDLTNSNGNEDLQLLKKQSSQQQLISLNKKNQFSNLNTNIGEQDKIRDHQFINSKQNLKQSDHLPKAKVKISENDEKFSSGKQTKNDETQMSQGFEENGEKIYPYNDEIQQKTDRFEDLITPTKQLNEDQTDKIRSQKNTNPIISIQSPNGVSLRVKSKITDQELEDNAHEVNHIPSNNINNISNFNPNNYIHKNNFTQNDLIKVKGSMSSEYINQENQDIPSNKATSTDLFTHSNSHNTNNINNNKNNITNKKSLLFKGQNQANNIIEQQESKGNNNKEITIDNFKDYNNQPNQNSDRSNQNNNADANNNDKHNSNNKIIKINQNEQESMDYSLYLFSTQNKIRKICLKIVDHKLFDLLMVLSIVIMSIILAIDSPFLDPNSHEKKVLVIISAVLTAIFFLEVILQIIAYGFILSKDSFIRKNYLFNSIDLITAIASFFYAANFWERQVYIFKFLLILRMTLLLFFLSQLVKDIDFAGKTLMKCLPRMVKLILFAVLYLLIAGVLATKLLKGSMNSCIFSEEEYQKLEVVTIQDCMDQGGDWIDSLYNFNNILRSLQVLFNVLTSEGWITIMFAAYDSSSRDRHSIKRHESLWSVFFIQFFFIANICILNMFVGLVVETQLEMIEQEHKTEDLQKFQKEWLFIKQSIYKLSPIPVIKVPLNVIRKFFHEQLIQGYGLKLFFYLFTITNCISFTLYSNRQSHLLSERLRVVNGVCLGAMSVEIIFKLIALQKEYFKDYWNVYDLIPLTIGWINFELQHTHEVTIFSADLRIFDGIAKGLQLLRFYRIMQHFTIIKKLFKSLQYAVSSIFGIFLVMIVFLFMSVLLSVNLFPFLKHQKTIDGYNIDFRSVFQALFALIRIMTSEAWYSIPSEASREMGPNFVCRDDIILYEDYQKYGQNSCGNPLSFLFFYGFFLIFTLVILNIFIATIIESYKEAFNADESAVNHYQLDDVLELWKQYDSEGKGYISYKEFWQFSSQIAIIYGVESEELRDIANKNKFLKTLNIPIFEDPINRILCYKFHDVVISLSKISVQIKYGITNLEPEAEELRIQLESLIQKSNLKGDGMIKPTPFTSADMVMMIVLTRKVKQWKNAFLNKDVDQVFDIKNATKKLRIQLKIEEEKEQQELEEQKKLQKEEQNKICQQEEQSEDEGTKNERLFKEKQATLKQQDQSVQNEGDNNESKKKQKVVNPIQINNFGFPQTNQSLTGEDNKDGKSFESYQEKSQSNQQTKLPVSVILEREEETIPLSNRYQHNIKTNRGVDSQAQFKSKNPLDQKNDEKQDDDVVFNVNFNNDFIQTYQTPSQNNNNQPLPFNKNQK